MPYCSTSHVWPIVFSRTSFLCFAQWNHLTPKFFITTSSWLLLFSLLFSCCCYGYCCCYWDCAHLQCVVTQNCPELFIEDGCEPNALRSHWYGLKAVTTRLKELNIETRQSPNKVETIYKSTTGKSFHRQAQFFPFLICL